MRFRDGEAAYGSRAGLGLTLVSLVCLPLLAAATAPVPRPARPSGFAALGAEFARDIRPLLQRYCLGCHSTARRTGELDLQRFTDLSRVRREPRVWQHALEQLDGGEMPPKSARQPAPAERLRLRSWIRRYLDAEALASAGDPGPVLLRRLNNAEYTYTIQDLTGVALEPAREFPADSAAGEGFTNAGGATVMSPALLAKYLDAAKEIARHIELLPDGFRFSPHTTRSDWTNAALDRIRSFYRRYADPGGASTVNLQGIVFNTNEGGRLPVERYLAALIAEGPALQAGTTTLKAVAERRNLSPRYLQLLRSRLSASDPSPLLDGLRARWRDTRLADVGPLTGEIGAWQGALWRFTTVGHIGRTGGPKAWMEPVTPLQERQEVRLKLPASPSGKEVVVHLVARDAGDGREGDVALWENLRLTAPGRPDLPLRDLRSFAGVLAGRRQRLVAGTASALRVADALERTGEAAPDTAALAGRHGVDRDVLQAWLDYLGTGASGPVRLAHFATPQRNPGYAFITGWGSPDLPSVTANSSDRHVRVPGNMKPGGVCVHPTPTLAACAGWQSPIDGRVLIEGRVQHAHPECGNGVTWALELRRGASRRRLAAGAVQGATPAPIAAVGPLGLRRGDLVSLVIGPRDGNHSCDLTDLELRIREPGPEAREWSLTRDVSPNILAGNPHTDSFGNASVWHFYSEPVSGGDPARSIPAGSLLSRWMAAGSSVEREELAAALQALLSAGPAAGGEATPDGLLYRALTAASSPLLTGAWKDTPTATSAPASQAGLDPALFGRHPDGGPVHPTALCARAPHALEVRVPAEIAAGAEIAATVGLHPGAAAGSIQAQFLLERPGNEALVAGPPVIAHDPATRARFQRAFEEYRSLFPPALAYTKIVPVDEVVTLTLFHREDDALRRLMLSGEEAARLDRLWEELHFVSQSPLKLVNAYEQIVEFATQDRPDLVEAFKPLREPILARAREFQKVLEDSEPRQLARLLEFAGRAYRRPLNTAESAEMRRLYDGLRKEGLSHEEALRLTTARVLVSPAFLYRGEAIPPTAGPAPVSPWELATRLSYFLWSSAPDDRLRSLAASGALRRPEVLAAETRRMLTDPRIRRLATEFACQWLHVYAFDTLDEKSERHFPGFRELRTDMYEETIRFFTDLFRRNGTVLSVFDADHTFVNERLARFYAVPGISGEEWRRVEGMRARGRGGILGLATTLARQSGASRTSPILRGNWVSEVLLGEKLPRPPKNVPQLPEDETAVAGLTVRQLVQRHTQDPRCSGCHARIDPFGFALEGFDAVGRRRTTDLGNRPVDTKTRTPDGRAIEGLAGLRSYLTGPRRADVLRQFCRKLLGYALGRAVQLSDEPLLSEMRRRLVREDYRITAAVETIVLSRQFREIRGNPRPSGS